MPLINNNIGPISDSFRNFPAKIVAK